MLDRLEVDTPMWPKSLDLAMLGLVKRLSPDGSTVGHWRRRRQRHDQIQKERIGTE